jgi:hypothetical protein
MGQHCPKFGVKRLVAVPLPQPLSFKAADEYKLQLSFDGDSHLTPWLPIIGKRAASPPYVEVELVRSGDAIKSGAGRRAGGGWWVCSGGGWVWVRWLCVGSSSSSCGRAA